MTKLSFENGRFGTETVGLNMELTYRSVDVTWFKVAQSATYVCALVSMFEMLRSSIGFLIRHLPRHAISAT